MPNFAVDLKSEACYKQALDDVIDPLLPTRGHALKQLSKMLRYRNPWAVGDQHKLFEIFEVNLKHDDTYLYLAAVDGLMSLVDVHHETVVPLLCRRFIHMKTDGKRNFYNGMSVFHTPLRLIYITRHLPLKAEGCFAFCCSLQLRKKAYFLLHLSLIHI